MISFIDKLKTNISEKNSNLCVGIDIDKKYFNKNASIDELMDYSYMVVDSTKDLAAAYKPNLAFFEEWGSKGFYWLEQLIKEIGNEHIIIADAKRGDIGSTSQAYANAYLGENAPFPSNALTVNPWLGIDSLEPFFKKASETSSGLFILVHTSNNGSKDIQEKTLTSGVKCYEHLANILRPIVEKYKGDLGLSSIGIVSGATFKEESLALRKLLPSAPFLIPGYGAQGASAKDACAPLIEDSAFPNLLNFGLINASRSILFPEEAYLAKNIEDWKKIILNKINSTNNELININK